MVEDNPADIRLMVEAIKRAGLESDCTTHFASNGEEAMSLLDASHMAGHIYDMVLLDLNMPRINGKEILSRIKASERYKLIPVFIMSNSNYVKDIIDCEKLGADAFFQKPTDFNCFVDFFIAVKNSMLLHHKISVSWITAHTKDIKTAA